MISDVCHLHANGGSYDRTSVSNVFESLDDVSGFASHSMHLHSGYSTYILGGLLLTWVYVLQSGTTCMAIPVNPPLLTTWYGNIGTQLAIQVIFEWNSCLYFPWGNRVETAHNR